MNFRRVAVARSPQLPCISAISQPRTRLVDFPFLRPNLLRTKSLSVSKDHPCATDVSPFGISPHQVLQFGTFPLFSSASPFSSSLFPQVASFAAFFRGTSVLLFSCVALPFYGYIFPIGFFAAPEIDFSWDRLSIHPESRFRHGDSA